MSRILIQLTNGGNSESKRIPITSSDLAGRLPNKGIPTGILDRRRGALEYVFWSQGKRKRKRERESKAGRKRGKVEVLAFAEAKRMGKQLR